MFYSAGSDKSALRKAFSILKSMNVSSIDFQIRSLQSIKLFTAFLHMLASVLESRQDFELIQSYLATFLNIHREKLWNFKNDEYGIKTEANLWGENEEETIENNIDLQQEKNEQKELTLVNFNREFLFILGS